MKDVTAELLYQIFKDRGFFHYQSGGGCTAYVKELPHEMELWVTHEVEAPSSWDQEVTVGLHNDDSDYHKHKEFATLREFLVYDEQKLIEELS